MRPWTVHPPKQTSESFNPKVLGSYVISIVHMNCCNFEKILFNPNPSPGSYIFFPWSTNHLCPSLLIQQALTVTVLMEMHLSSSFFSWIQDSVSPVHLLSSTYSGMIHHKSYSCKGKDTIHGLLHFNNMSTQTF